MAAALTQNGLHVGFEPRQKLHGHKGLYGAGKAAAVDADSALAAQEMFGRRNGHGHLLVLLVTGGDHVLQVLPAALAGFAHQIEECGKIALPQGSDLFCHPVIVRIDMERAEDSPVAALFTALRQLCDKRLKGNIPQHLAAADSGHGAALIGDGGIFVGQVGVVGTGIQDAEGEARLREVHGHRLHDGLGGVGKINGDDVAHAGSHLSIRPQGLPK